MLYIIYVPYEVTIMNNWCLKIVGAESRFENGVMDLAELMNKKDVPTEFKCYTENQISSCIPNTPDDKRCNQLCLVPCEKGGHCTDKHLCHCAC